MAGEPVRRTDKPIALPDLPQPAVCYADHSYPAFSKKQMEEYAQLAAARWRETARQEAELANELAAEKAAVEALLVEARLRIAALESDLANRPVCTEIPDAE